MGYKTRQGDNRGAAQRRPEVGDEETAVLLYEVAIRPTAKTYLVTRPIVYRYRSLIFIHELVYILKLLSVPGLQEDNDQSASIETLRKGGAVSASIYDR